MQFRRYHLYTRIILCVCVRRGFIFENVPPITANRTRRPSKSLKTPFFDRGCIFFPPQNPPMIWRHSKDIIHTSYNIIISYSFGSRLLIVHNILYSRSTWNNDVINVKQAQRITCPTDISKTVFWFYLSVLNLISYNMKIFLYYRWPRYLWFCFIVLLLIKYMI